MSVMTVGVFDGVHLGHQQLIRHIREIAGRSVVLTFSNHPAEILSHSAPPQISAMPIKRILLQETGIDEIIPIPFTRQLAGLTFEEFLEPYAISHLILGDGAAFGKDCHGTPDALRILGLKRGFTVRVLPKLCIDGQPVSSTRIRRSIAAGKLDEAQTLLGRPYFFYYIPGDPKKPFLPPDGKYRVWSYSQSRTASVILTVQNQYPCLSENTPQLISFGPNLNPQLIRKICQTSLAAS